MAQQKLEKVKDTHQEELKKEIVKHEKEKEKLLEGKDEEIHQLKQQSLAYQDILQPLNVTLTPQTFDHIYKHITGDSSSIGEDYKLILDLSKPKHMKLIEALRYTTIPNLEWIRLDKVPVDNLFVKEFMKNSFPQKVKWFHFNYNGELMNVDGYLDKLLSINERVSEHL